MKIIDPLQKITTTSYIGCTDVEFQEALIEGRNEILFKNFEGCVEIPIELTKEVVPDVFGGDQIWEERFITFIKQDESSYLILGNKNGEYTWGAMKSEEIFDIYEYFETLPWFDIEMCHTSEYLKERVTEWVAENTPDNNI